MLRASGFRLFMISRRNKLKLQRLKINLRKNVFNTRFMVRNTLVLMITVAVVFLAVFAVDSLKGLDGNKSKGKSEKSVADNELMTRAIATGIGESIKTESSKAKDAGQEKNINKEPVKVKPITEIKYNMAGKVICKVVTSNIRAEASDDSEIVGCMYEGAAGKIDKKEGDWYKIVSGKVTGYVKAEDVLADKEATSSAEKYATKIAVIKNAVGVKDFGSDDGNVIITVDKDRTFEISVHSSNDQIKCIRLADGAYGYVSVDDVKVVDGFPEAFSMDDMNEVLEGRNNILVAENEKVVEEASNEDGSSKEETPDDTEVTEVTEEESSEEVTEEEDTEEATTEEVIEEKVEEEEEAEPEPEEVDGYHAAGGFAVDDIKLLAAIVYAESGGESYEGQLAVANVVLNRLNNGWGGSLSDVIYAENQFTATETWAFDDALKNGAPDTTLSAVYAAVGGKNNIKNYTSFRPTWNIDTSELNDYEIIGNHCFFTE